jgi:hypothetical protein
MSLSAADRSRLVEILVANVPLTTFTEVVRDQRVVTNYEVLRKQAPEDPNEARRWVAQTVIDIYDAAGRLQQFAKELYRRAYLDDQLTPLLLPFVLRANDDPNGDAAKEAAIAKRANTMSARALREFLAENEGKICVVAATIDNPPAGDARLRMGTGFLVGPDVVLTAYHTLAGHIRDGKPIAPSPGACFAFFDYYEGDPLQAPDPIPSGSIRIPFAAEWLIDCKQDMPSDGLFLEPDADQIEQLATHLDFALVKLAVPVGKQTRRAMGGARRSWVTLKNGAPLALAQDDRIIIPQHPNGYPQRIDFGRFSQSASELDRSATRLRYDTETEQGTSGAPCFDQRFSLVGMHNASFAPKGIDLKKNQAIRIDRILAVLKSLPDQAEPEAIPAPLWNASSTAEPSVILGRQTLLDWISLASVEVSRSCDERIYAAYLKPDDLASNAAFGKTYTIEILKAARRGAAEPMVILGTPDNLLPETVADVIRAIGFQLGIDKTVLDTMPTRPAADLPVAAPNADKLRRWASEDVPQWFDRVLGDFREQVVDLRVEAQKRIDVLKANGIPPSPDDVALAQQPKPQLDTRRRWPIAWIVLTDLLRVRLTEEVRDLIAGLIGGKLSEASMPQNLRRLRWVFIGYVPDFLSADQVTREVLDPRGIGEDSLANAAAALSDSMALDFTERERLLMNGMIRIHLSDPRVAKAVDDPTQRLPTYQPVFPALANVLASLQVNK